LIYYHYKIKNDEEGENFSLLLTEGAFGWILI